MIVNDLDLSGITAIPMKADPELVVDPDAVLPRAIATKPFETITGRSAQELQGRRCMQLGKFSPDDGFQERIATNPVSREELRNIAIRE